MTQDYQLYLAPREIRRLLPHATLQQFIHIPWPTPTYWKVLPHPMRDAILEGVPDHIAAAALIAWSGLFGLVSFELFGQFENVVTDRAAFFDHAAACLGRLTGVPA